MKILPRIESCVVGAPICDTCKSKITQHPFRHIILENNKEAKTIYFHYFFPCWDSFLVIQKYPQYRITQAGFTFNDSALPDESQIYNMTKNLDLWITY